MAHYDGYYFGYVSYITYVPGSVPSIPRIAPNAGFGPLLPLPDEAPTDIITLADIDRVSYLYDNFTGTAPDALSAYIPFGYRSLYLSIIAFGDIVIDFTEAGTNPYVVYNDPRKKIYKLEVEGFRIRNLIPGDNVEYQILSYH